MAITSGRTTVGTAATIVDGISPNPSRLHVHNNDNTDSVFLGNETVTTSTGLQLLKLDSIELTLNAGESLYAVSTSGSHTISWLRQTQY